MRFIKKTKFDSIMKEILVRNEDERFYICQNDRHNCGQLFKNMTKFRQHIEPNCFVFYCTHLNCSTTNGRYDNYLKHVKKYHSK
jgi:hypothetical protein